MSSTYTCKAKSERMSSILEQMYTQREIVRRVYKWHSTNLIIDK